MLGGVAGCQPPPSFELRWTIDRTARADFAGEGLLPLTNPSQCSRVGITLVQLLTYQTFEGSPELVLFDYEELPCFPRQFFTAGDVVGGPNLPDGDYIIGLRAVQNTPARHAWLDLEAVPPPCLEGNPDNPETCPVCDPSGTACQTGMGVCDCEPVSIDNDGIPVLSDFTLVAPPECEDGIDGDRDGLIDGDDPGCAQGTESGSDTRSTLAVEVQLLGVPEDQAPQGSCASLGIDHYDAALQGLGGSVWNASLPCSVDSSSDREFALDVPPGAYEFVYSARDAAGAAVTAERRVPMAIDAGGNTAYLDVWGEDFAQAIVEPATIVACAGTDPAITHMRLNVVGPRREPANVSDSEGTPLDGTVVLPCETRVTEPLTWGTFAVEATLLAGEVACFDNLLAPTYLWPGAETALIPATATGAAGCPECLYDVHCGSGQVCVASVCQG